MGRRGRREEGWDVRRKERTEWEGGNEEDREKGKRRRGRMVGKTFSDIYTTTTNVLPMYMVRRPTRK